MAVITLLEEREAVQTSSSIDLCADTNFLFSIACYREKPVFTAQTPTNSIIKRDFISWSFKTPLRFLWRIKGLRIKDCFISECQKFCLFQKDEKYISGGIKSLRFVDYFCLREARESVKKDGLLLG